MEKKNEDIIFYGNLNGKCVQGYAYSVYGIYGNAPTLTANSGGGHMPYILTGGKNEDAKFKSRKFRPHNNYGWIWEGLG